MLVGMRRWGAALSSASHWVLSLKEMSPEGQDCSPSVTNDDKLVFRRHVSIKATAYLSVFSIFWVVSIKQI